MRLGGRSSLIQYSVFQTDRRRVAVAAKKLAEHYGASTEVFKGPENRTLKERNYDPYSLKITLDIA